MSRCEYLNKPVWRCFFYARLQKTSRCDLLPRVSRHGRHENITQRTLRVLTLRALRLRCGRCVQKIKKFTPRTLREIHAKSATSTYVAGVAFLSPHPVPLPLVIGHGLEERGRFDQIVLQNINLITSNFVRFGAHHRSVEILCKLRGGGSLPWESQ